LNVIIKLITRISKELFVGCFSAL